MRIRTGRSWTTALAVLLFALPAARAIEVDGGEGCMPYGKDWSFAVTVPEGWVGECSAEETHGVTVALWPEGAKWPEAPGLLYVTTTRRNGRPLSEVMSADQAEYLRHAPGGSVTPDAPVALARLKLSVPVVRTEAAANGRAELIAYGETPNVVVLMVLTAENAAALDSRREDFVRFVRSFLPVDRVREKPVEAAPDAGAAVTTNH
jgi:hypothetical protein